MIRLPRMMDGLDILEIFIMELSIKTQLPAVGVMLVHRI